jgi:hypothetical protein
MQLRMLGLALLAACGPGDGGGLGGSVDGAVNGQPDATPGAFPDAASCASTRREADEALAPVDIIWVVDSSGSMSNEETAVQNALNDFSSFIDQSSIDYHVILIGDAGSMNVPPPLGGSAEFLHVNQTISSTNALQMVHATYAQYQAFLRPQATLHIVVVTDDESDWSPSQFNSSIASLTNPGLRADYVMHAICSEEVAIITPPPPLPPVMGPCSGGLGTGGAADPGLRYIEMVNDTGGVWRSICTSNWTPIFTAVAQAVSVGIALPCTFDLPDPPMGESLDPDRVNFVFTPSGGGNAITVPRVSDQTACGSAPGWYYDDPAMPTQILVCPATCSVLEGDPNGAVEIEFGCASVVL